jgi:hypothetical protein
MMMMMMMMTTTTLTLMLLLLMMMMIIPTVDCSTGGGYLQIFQLSTVFNYLCYFSPPLPQLTNSSTKRLTWYLQAAKNII